MNRWLEIIKGLYLKWKIETTEKRLCKHVSKFLDKRIVAISKYVEEVEYETWTELKEVNINGEEARD